MTPHSDGPDGPHARRRAPRASRTVAPAIASLVALGAAGLVVSGAVGPVAARFSGSTNSTGSLMRTAAVDLRVGGTGDPATGSLAIEADNLVPGDRVQRCVRVSYAGTATGVDVRLLGRSDGGSGLDAFLRTDVETGSGTDPGCADFEPGAVVWQGVLRDLWERHAVFADGVTVLAGVDDGAATTLRVTVELVDDDRGQGLDTGFWLVLEARP